MKHGLTPIKERETSGLASAGAGVEPAEGEREHAVSAPQSAGDRAREFEWSLATYFGQSFVVGAYRARDRG